MDDDDGRFEELPIELAFTDWPKKGGDGRARRLNKDRPYSHPYPWNVYPRFWDADIKSVRLSLDDTLERARKPGRWIPRLYWRVWKVRLRRLLPAVAALFSWSFFGAVNKPEVRQWFQGIAQHVGWQIGQPALNTLAVALPVVVCLVYLAYVLTRPRERFFRHMAAAERAAKGWKGHQDFVRCMNMTGRAARMLFRYLQRSRRTWLAPPTVADIALKSASPLIDISVMEPSALGKSVTLIDIRLFLRDVSYLVVLEREDLIPRLRDRYETIKRRQINDDDAADADARYLDPMRNMTRWEVRKEFYYPLSAWFSVIVAIVALVVSIVK